MEEFFVSSYCPWSGARVDGGINNSISDFAQSYRRKGSMRRCFQDLIGLLRLVIYVPSYDDGPRPLAGGHT